jgi:hypothetical protein
MRWDVRFRVVTDDPVEEVHALPHLKRLKLVWKLERGGALPSGGAPHREQYRVA